MMLKITIKNNDGIYSAIWDQKISRRRTGGRSWRAYIPLLLIFEQMRDTIFAILPGLHTAQNQYSGSFGHTAYERRRTYQ